MQIIPSYCWQHRTIFWKKSFEFREGIFTVWRYSVSRYTCLQQLHVHLHAPYKPWQFLFPMKERRDWCNTFLIIEFCICTPYSNVELKRFFSQMWAVKTDWCNCLSNVNLTCLFRIKVADLSLKLIHDNYCHLAIDLWFNEKERQLGQKQCKKYGKRKSTKKLHSESLIYHHYMKQVAKVNWRKNLVQINIQWWHWHYFITYIVQWKVYWVNYKEESSSWKYIAKFTVSNKLTWKFARWNLITKLPSLKVCCWYLHKFHNLKNVFF